MTIEERFNRIEHFTAAEAEQRRKEREENRQLWRDTQRQINELTIKIADTNDAITRFAEESREADARLGARLDALAEESREADARLGARIDSLISGMGQFIAKFQPQIPKE